MSKEKQKILIIEDDVSLFNILETKLKQTGYDVLAALDGESGFKMAEKEKPDLILLDIVMPNLNGVETLKKIRKSDIVKSTKILVLTNSGKKNEMEEMKNLGIEDYLIKSELSLEEIREKVEKNLK